VSYSAVPINFSLLTITLSSLVITIPVYNDKNIRIHDVISGFHCISVSLLLVWMSQLCGLCARSRRLTVGVTSTKRNHLSRFYKCSVLRNFSYALYLFMLCVHKIAIIAFLLLGTIGKFAKTDCYFRHVYPSVCPRGKIRLPQDRILQNLV
jgi:hypothetical protein